MGRMGQLLVQEVMATSDLMLSGGLEYKGHAAIGFDVGEKAGAAKAGLLITDDAASLIAASDVLVDFTLPENSLHCLELARKANKAYVMGTTGFSALQQQAIIAAATDIPLLLSANMSLGVNLLAELVRQASAILDDAYDIEIVEMHHKHKVDAPSGTALLLGNSAAEGRKIALVEHQVLSRQGHSGARKVGDIGFATLRGGDVAGDHTVIFAGEGERLELTHKAGNRRLFAKGAITAARWLASKKAGQYSMKDVLFGA